MLETEYAGDSYKMLETVFVILFTEIHYSLYL